MRRSVRWLVRYLATGVTMLLVGAGFYLLVPAVAPGIPPQFANAALFRPWAGWTSVYMVLHPLGYGFVFATVFVILLRRSAVTPTTRGGAGGR